MKNEAKKELLAVIANNASFKKAAKIFAGYTADNFVSDANEWITALEQRMMICAVKSVSASGMSRKLKFLSAYSDGGFRNYTVFLAYLGYMPSKDDDFITVKGCGMDMIFATNYNIIYKLSALGIISEERANKLCQISIQVI